MSRPPLDRLTRQDAGYIRRETDNQPMHFVLHARVGPRPDGSAVALAEVRDHIAARIHRVPELRRRVKQPPLGLGQPVWVDDVRFDITRHVVAWPLTTLAAAGVHEGLSTLAAQRLDLRWPAWRLAVSPAAEDGVVHVALAVHHALMDGGLVVEILSELFGDASSPPPAPAPRRASALRLLAAGVHEAIRFRLDRRRRPTPCRRATQTVAPAC